MLRHKPYLKVLKKNSKNGFTLMEVILAVTILSTLTVLVTQAISRALKAKTKIQAEVDDVSALRDSMRMIRNDLYMAFHFRDFYKEINDAYKKLQTTTPGGSPPGGGTFGVAKTTTPPPEAAPKDASTHFIGTEDKMNFVTSNNGKISTSSQQADFVEVGYFLKDCKGLSEGAKTSKCLFRRMQMVLDDDPEAGGTEMPMLENVSEFKLRYIGAGKTEWTSQWNSKSGMDASTKNKYPDAVEVSLGVEREIGGKKKEYSMQFVIPIHFVNNPTTTNSSGMQVPTAPAAEQSGGL